MRTISKRVQNLEKESGAAGGTQQLLLVVSRAGWGIALDQDTCIRILGENWASAHRAHGHRELPRHPGGPGCGGDGEVPSGERRQARVKR
jgi:hypothetical protein